MGAILDPIQINPSSQVLLVTGKKSIGVTSAPESVTIVGKDGNAIGSGVGISTGIGSGIGSTGAIKSQAKEFPSSLRGGATFSQQENVSVG